MGGKPAHNGPLMATPPMSNPLGLCIHEGQPTFHCPVHGPISVQAVLVVALRLCCRRCVVEPAK